MLILATDKRKPSTELHSDSRIRRVSNFRRKDRILPSTKPKGKWHLKTNRVFCLLLAESQVHKLKGQDSKSVKSRRSNCRRSVSSQVVDNTKKTPDFFGDLVLAIKPLEKSMHMKIQIRCTKHIRTCQTT